MRWTDEMSILSVSDIDDDGLLNLNRLSGLNSLYIIACRLTEASLKHIMKCSNINYIQIRDSVVTDAMVLGLIDLRGLESVSLVNCLGHTITPSQARTLNSGGGTILSIQ